MMYAGSIEDRNALERTGQAIRAAFARGDYESAVQHLEPVTDQVVRVGGSNAQREVFEDTLLQAYLRAERYAQAESLLRKRLARRPSTRDTLWLQQAQSGYQTGIGSSCH